MLRVLWDLSWSTFMAEPKHLLLSLAFVKDWSTVLSIFMVWSQWQPLLLLICPLFHHPKVSEQNCYFTSIYLNPAEILSYIYWPFCLPNGHFHEWFLHSLWQPGTVSFSHRLTKTVLEIFSCQNSDWIVWTSNFSIDFYSSNHFLSCVRVQSKHIDDDYCAQLARLLFVL